jgi:hypothetical protein
VVASSSASGTLTLPAATDTLIARATTDTLTNKTYDTAGAGNVLKINGTQVSAVTGTGSTAVLSTSPTFSTSITAPIHYGGSAAGSTLNLQSTSNGAPSGDSITLTTGGSVRGTLLSNGNLGWGTETNPQFPWVWSANATTGATISGASLTGPVAVSTTGAPAGWNTITVAGVGVNSFNRINGTLTSPSNLSSGDIIGQFSFSGWGNGAFQAGKLRIAGITPENWSSATNLGAFLEIDTTPAGSGTRAQSARFMAGFIVGTGTIDPGPNNLIAGGTIEATGVFRNNGNAGLSATKTVRASGGAADCTLIYTGGILTGGTC